MKWEENRKFKYEKINEEERRLCGFLRKHR